MKYTLVASLLALTVAASSDTKIADIKIEPFDIKSGYWLTQYQLVFNKEFDDMLSSLPAERRASMKELIEAQAAIPDVKTCVSEEDLRNYDQELLKTLGSDEGCDVDIKESTKTSFAGQYQCDDIKASFAITVLNPKTHVTEISMFANNVEQSKLRLTARWQSSECPPDALQ